MLKKSMEVLFHIACFLIICVLTLIVQPIFLKNSGVNQIIIEETVGFGIVAVVFSIASFIFLLVSDIRDEKKGY